jgi:methylglutaconyl-CoA hydratase
MEFIELEKKDSCLTIWLNRVDKRNAFDANMATRLIEAYSLAKDDNNISMVALRGRGPTFCAGGDINWMSDLASCSVLEREKNARLIAKLFGVIARFPKPTLAVVHGHAFGGAVGLTASSDFVLATKGARFATSEGKLGIVPACLAPHLINRIGLAQTRRMFLWAELIDANEALRIGLIDRLVSDSEIDIELKKIVSQLDLTSNFACQTAKQLLVDLMEGEESKREDLSIKCLADSWGSPDGKEGMRAFLEKRKPHWEDGGNV